MDDFIFNIQGNQLMHVGNAPSRPAASCLAIGELIADEWTVPRDEGGGPAPEP